MSEKTKILIAFDFDHTIIDENSDTYVSKLCEGGKVPDDIEEMFSVNSWTFYMAAIFEHLHKIGITADGMKKCMHELPFTDGMKDLLTYLDSDEFDIIIISDSNSVFIEYVLEHANLRHIVDRVYTNPAHFDETGCLKIEYYHKQDWCDLSTINLCKGHILEDHIRQKLEKENVSYSCMFYVGDGTNDLCPGLKLNKGDYICVRKDFRLWKKMKKLGMLDGKTTDLDMKANVCVWETGHDVLNLLKSVQAGKNM